MPKHFAFAVVFAALFALNAPLAEGATCTVSVTLVNGHTADANQVMQDFNDLSNCAAPVANPHFTGAVGIGTTTPGATLDVRGLARVGAIGTEGSIQFDRGDGAYAGLVGYDDGGLGEQFTIQSAGGGSYIRFVVGAALEAMRVNTAGSVGIGTANAALLSASVLTVEAGSASGINNALVLNSAHGFGSGVGAAASALLFSRTRTSDTANAPVDQIVGGNENELSSGSGYLSFYTANIGGTLLERMRINSAGNVGIGTASPGVALHVVGAIRQTNCTLATTLSADPSGTIICTPSDARLKNVLGIYSSGLDELIRITPKSFTFKATAQSPADSFVHAGFIAQDVMLAIPEAVMQQRNGLYSLDTTAILAAAVNSVKQLKALVDRQSVDIARVEKANAALAATSREQSEAIGQLRAELAAFRHTVGLRRASK